MARILSIANTKGGVGKSTLATNFAVTLANGGQRVLLVDADPQASSMSFLSVRDDERTKVQCVQITQPILHKQLPELSQPFDVVLIDVGGRDAPVFRSALVSSTEILIPVVPSAFDAWASSDVVEVVEELLATNDSLKAHAVLNMVTRTVVARDAVGLLRDDLAEHGITLLSSMLVHRTAWARAVGEGLSVSEWEPEGSAATECLAVMRELGLVGTDEATE